MEKGSPGYVTDTAGVREVTVQYDTNALNLRGDRLMTLLMRSELMLVFDKVDIEPMSSSSVLLLLSCK